MTKTNKKSVKKASSSIKRDKFGRFAAKVTPKKTIKKTIKKAAKSLKPSKKVTTKKRK